MPEERPGGTGAESAKKRFPPGNTPYGCVSERELKSSGRTGLTGAFTEANRVFFFG